ncbi:hypothetical protein Tco_1573059, partial [Tanacetum coccineum]
MGHESARTSTLQFFLAVVTKKHIDYATLIWDGLKYNSKHHGRKPKNIPFVRYTKLIIDAGAVDSQEVLQSPRQ